MTRDERIDVMLDKHEITELLYAYCNAADRHDHVLTDDLRPDRIVDLPVGGGLHRRRDRLAKPR